MVGPAARPAPATTDQADMARARSRRPGWEAARIARLCGMVSADPAPCRARPASSAGSPGAVAQTTEPTTKTATPIRKTRRRPKRSPRVPPVSIRAANVTL